MSDSEIKDSFSDLIFKSIEVSRDIMVINKKFEETANQLEKLYKDDDKFKKIVRTDTDHFLGLVKSRYHPINHMNAFMGAIEAIEAGGVSLSLIRLVSLCRQPCRSA